MKPWLILISLSSLLFACQSLPKEGLHHSADRPFGAESQKPFDDMIANARPAETLIGSVHFGSASSTLTDTEKIALEPMAQTIIHRAGPAMIEGHTDNADAAENQQRLGYLRALAVADYLKSVGVWDERIIIRSFGENRPAATNWTEAGKQENNRVDVKMFAQGEGMSGKEAAQVQAKLIGRQKAKTTGRQSFFDQMMDSLKNSGAESGADKQGTAQK